MRMGPLEIGIILVIVLIIFGVGKLPQVGEALGKGIRSFRQAQSEDDTDENKGVATAESVKTETQVEPKPIEAAPQTISQTANESG